MADLDGNSSLTTHYLHGDAVDQVFARIGAGGGAAWLLSDHLGSVRGVTDSSGVLKDTIAYDGWGNITSESDATWGGHYKWTGRELDTETNLQYNRARYYDAKTGKWTSEDPLGFGAGDSNLYRYVYNATPVAIDPSGKAEQRLGISSKDGNLDGIVKARISTDEERPVPRQDVFIRLLYGPGIRIGYYGKNAQNVRWIQFYSHVTYLAFKNPKTVLVEKAHVELRDGKVVRVPEVWSTTYDDVPYQPLKYRIPSGQQETTPSGVGHVRWEVDTSENSRTGKLDSPIYTDGGSGEISNESSWIHDNPTVTPLAARKFLYALNATRVIATMYFVDFAVCGGKAFARVAWYDSTTVNKGPFGTRMERHADFVYPGIRTELTSKGKGSSGSFSTFVNILNREYGADQKYMYAAYPDIQVK